MENSFIQKFLQIILLAVIFLFAIFNMHAGTLQFRSGFEQNVRISSNLVKGVDLSVGKEENNNWEKISKYLGWPIRWNSYRENGGSINIVSDPIDPKNKVLLLHNPSSGVQHSHHGRSQLTILQNSGKVWVDDGKSNKFDKQFYRYRMYISSDIAKAVPKETRAPWYMIWESHAWPDMDETRHGVYLQKDRGSNFWYFHAVQQHPEGTTVWNSNTKVEVPFDRWFTIDVFFKYHKTDGEFYVAVTDSMKQKEIGRFQGRTQNGKKLHDQMLFKMYHSGAYYTLLDEHGFNNGTRQYYDDFEIWSDYPPNYLDTLKQVIIFKFDDLSQSSQDAFQKVADIVYDKEVKAGFGIIANSCDGDDNSKNEPYYNRVKKFHNSGLIEIWAHGFDHFLSGDTVTEFLTMPYQHQYKNFKRSIDLTNEKLGITMRTFGAPGNRSDATTVSVMNQFPQIEVFLFPYFSNSNNKQLLLKNRVDMERGTGNMDYDYFLKNYHKNIDNPYMVLQGHPGIWRSNDFEVLNKIISFLKTQKVIFMTPYEYFKFLKFNK